MYFADRLSCRIGLCQEDFGISEFKRWLYQRTFAAVLVTHFKNCCDINFESTWTGCLVKYHWLHWAALTTDCLVSYLHHYRGIVLRQSLYWDHLIVIMYCFATFVTSFHLLGMGAFSIFIVKGWYCCNRSQFQTGVSLYQGMWPGGNGSFVIFTCLVCWNWLVLSCSSCSL